MEFTLIHETHVGAWCDFDAVDVVGDNLLISGRFTVLFSPMDAITCIFKHYVKK